MNVSISLANMKSQNAIKHDICSASLGLHTYTVRSSILLKAEKTDRGKAFSEACVQRIAEAESRALPKERRFEHKFSEANLAQIERLREEGDSWAIVLTTMNHKSTLGAFKVSALSHVKKTKVPQLLENPKLHAKNAQMPPMGQPSLNMR
jgi:hypothetical protein